MIIGNEKIKFNNEMITATCDTESISSYNQILTCRIYMLFHTDNEEQLSQIRILCLQSCKFDISCAIFYYWGY